VHRILITGASGFIGGHFLRSLQPHQEVIALGRSRPEGNYLVDVDWIQHDLTTPIDPHRLPSQVDTIVHFAQSRVYKNFPERAEDIFQVNVSGSFQLLEYARTAGVRQFIFASSGGVYQLSNKNIAENDPIQPLSFYLSSKYATEVLMRNYEPFFQRVILRLFFVYGPGQQQGMLIPSLVQRIKNNDMITVDGNPGMKINPIFVEDAARAVVSALNLRISGEFNVAGDEVVSITDLANTIALVLGREVKIQHADNQMGGNLIADNSRMKEILLVRPRMCLLDGLRCLVEH